jgi:hypothetical protein
MKFAGMLLLLAGWAIVVAAIPLFPGTGMRAVFVLAGCAVESVGLVLSFRSEAK